MTHTAGAVVGGKYELEQPLARGGMGSVWIAVHQELGTRVAIKFMDPELADDDSARARFKREAKSAATLRSPHVVQIFDYGVDDDAPYIAMELLEGEDLRRRLKAGRVPLDVASVILTQTCKALQLAAEAGIVHRDLKPGNIFLARTGDEEVVKVLDFGLAKAYRRPRLGDDTGSGVLLGSPHYMSPEQARGGGAPIDHRADLWSMGAILFHMILGQKPFPGDDLGEVILQVCSEPLPVPRQVDPTLPPAIDVFFARAFERSAEARYQSARHMADDFAKIVAHHLGRPQLSASASGMLLAPDRASPSSPTAAAGSELGSGSGNRARSDGKGTLTLATSSLDRPPGGGRRAGLLWAGLGAALLAGALVGYVVLRSESEGSGAPAGMGPRDVSVGSESALAEPPSGAAPGAPDGGAVVSTSSAGASSASAASSPSDARTPATSAPGAQAPAGPAATGPAPVATGTKTNSVLGF